MSTMGDKRMYQLTVAINKALNPMEAPLKIKHARSAIIITHRSRESKSFWVICTRQPLMENRFTAWKFCHLLHKVLREGHESVLKQSLTHRKMIIEMGKLWGHLQDGVGHCIKAYSKLLVTKINFHEKNRIFPGSLIIADFADIERYAQGDINVHFQMCVEIFDYLDDILEVQTTVFTSINSYRMSSMTPQGQCRLAPLITLIQDSNPLYDVCVRLMFRLHDELPNDILSGHRDRFRELFRRLKQFYDNVRPLQYFADLIQVPHLPEMSPNFSSRVDFGSYVPPVVHVPEEPEPEHDPMVNDLVDTSYAQQQEVEESAVPPAAPTNLEVMQLEQNIRERDQRIFELQSDLIATRESVNMLEQQYKQKVSEMREEYVLLSNELATANEQCANLRLERDDLELKLENTTPTLLAKATEGEEKAKQSEEKFNKLKSLYTSIRDEHVQLLRKHGESTKELNREQSAKQELQQRCEESAKEINELKEKCALVQAQTEQMKELEAQRSALEEECSTLRQQFEALAESKGNEVEELSKQLQQLAITSQELTASRAEIDDLKEQLQVTKTNLQETKSEHAEVLLKLQDELKQRLEEIKANREQAEALQEELSAVRSQLQQEQTDKMSTKTEMQLELSNKAIALSERELTIVSLNKQISELQTNLELQAETSETTLNTMQETLGKTTSELSLTTQTLEEKSALLQQTKEELIASQQALEAETAKFAEESRAKLELQQTVEQLTKAKNELSACLERSNAAAQATKETLELELRNYQHRFDQMRLAVAQQACVFYAERAEDNNNQGYRQAQQTALQLEQSLQALQEAYRTYRQGDGVRFAEVQKLSISVIALTQQLCMLYEQGNFIAHTAADIEKSELLSQRLHELCKLLEHLHQSLQQTESAGLESAINSQFQELSKLNTEVSILLSSLLQSLNKQTDLGDMVQNELNEMDAAIEEAVSRFVDLLSATRQQDAGVQLEVNEKILDACTGLMECIKQLIKKSKLLQDEIVSAGRGKSSVKDFYKRNSQWTEGLISASKSVARGANLLVDAANKAVESPETSEHFQIIVAAQEIAACTAQLVIASKVKAPQNSAKLGELTIASRNVSKATGAVVATVKSCSQDLEQAQEIDVTKLTASQLKAMEMEIHVKVLQLEQALEMERRRLSAFRRQNYQNNEE